MKKKFGSRGAAMVELVVIAPVLLLLLFGLVEAGNAGDLAIKIGNAARAGVAYGAQNHTTAADIAGMETAANNDANTAGVSAIGSFYCQCEDLSASTCGQANACSTNHQNLYVKVVVTGTKASMNDYNGLPAALRTLSITQTAIMRVLQ